jgi:hypothetical protein
MGGHYPLSYNLRGCFKNIYPPINSEFWPLEVVKPSFLALKPSSTYTLIGSWCKSTSKMLLIVFLELLFLESYKMPKDFWQTLSPLPGCFMVFILFFIINMGNMRKGSSLLNHL